MEESTFSFSPLKENDKIVFGPFIGELGWEITRWCGFVRWFKTKNLKKNIVAVTRADRVDLYHKYVDNIMTFEIEGDYLNYRPNMYRLDFFPEENYQKLHVLINNAGAMLSKRVLTEKGLEMNFAVNYLAPFLLSCSLLDILKKSSPSRIINVSSAAHRMAKLDFNDLQNENTKYKLFKIYGKSKLALMLFTYELSRRLGGTGITVNAVHPGLVNTNLGREQSKFSQGFAKLFFKSPSKGAETSIYLASSPDVEGITGKYWIKKEQRESSENSYNEEDAKKLWDLTVNLIGDNYKCV